MTQTNRDPADLSIHPLAKKQPGLWAKDDPRFHALCDDVGARGILFPLLINSQNQILDGRRRWLAAKARQLPLVRCLVVDDSVAEIIVATLLHRTHYTPGQRAYLLAPTLDDAFAEAHKRMLAGGKSGPSALSAEGVKTPDAWANEIGVSIRLLRDARKLLELFADDKKRQFTDADSGKKDGPPQTFREYYEPKILDPEDPMGMGAAIAGIGFHLACDKKGGVHKGGKPDDKNRQLELFNKLTDDEFNRWEYWTKFDPDTQAAHFKHIRQKAAEIETPEELEARAEYHERVAKEFRKAAKEATAAKGDK
jgi:hypothetical protein